MRISRASLALAAAGVAAIRGEVRVAASPSPGDGPALSRDVRPVGEKPGRFRAAADRPALARGRQGLRGAGALAGKAVYLSAGHGWLYGAGAWRTQRGNTHDLVEDFITIEGVNEHLVRYLQLMGAYVVPIREADRNPNQVVVDDPDAAIEGAIAEVAEPGAGWGPFPAPFDDDALAPFGRGGARAMTAAAAETGRAVFAAAIPETGFYNVYLAYVQGPDRAPDAHVIVRHSGGESHLRIDQRRHGSTWMLLGRWHFEAGAGPERASLAVGNDSGQPGSVVSFDAARFGGGMAPHSRGGATTGRPAYESAAAYQAQLSGAPRTVYDYYANDQTDDVVARPRFAAWEHEAGEDAIYLAWHTNAPDPGRGTLSIAYGNTYPCCAGLDDFAGTAGSLELLHAVHGELVADLRAAWDPAWRDQGKATASLGELSPAHNPEMPAILVELGYHSTAADAEALRDPRFRAIAARAMAQGVARYFAAADGRPLVLPPEPPIAVRVENAGPGTLRVSWRPPPADPAGGDAPAGYRVYVSENGLGFDDGVAATGESLELTGLPRAALRFVRVAAVNDGGESMPTEVVGARLAAAGAAPTLIVGGFDRLDRSQVVRDAAPLVGEVDRVWLDRMNDGTYAARHGRALAAAGYAFDGATDEAVAARDVDLTAYRAIDWFAGEDAAGALPAEARAELARFFGAGGGLLVSGAELIWALDTQGGEEEQRFARDALHVSLAADDAEAYDAIPQGGPFAALAPLSFLDLAPGGYDVRFPDVLIPGAAATPVLAYGGPGGGAAAIAWDAGSRGVVLGFPLEVVQGEDARRALIDAALSYLGVEKDPEQPADLGSEDPVGCGCAGSAGAGAGAPGLLAALLVLRPRRRRRRR
jgi:N-acetylmuramoyl-L-alanine amidase